MIIVSIFCSCTPVFKPVPLRNLVHTHVQKLLLVSQSYFATTWQIHCILVFPDIRAVAEDKRTNDIFVAASVATGYAWNNSPIDGTGILCSILVIGRELRFPLDVGLSALPSIVSNNAESVVSYLRLTDSNRYFASTILKILVEDRRIIHVERINNNRNIVTTLHGDLVMACTTVQSDKANDKVAKLCYAVRSSFQIICGTGRGGYIVRKLNKSDSPEFKFMSEDLYILPPSLNLANLQMDPIFVT